MLNKQYLNILKEIKYLYERDLELADLLVFEKNTNIFTVLNRERKENIKQARDLLQVNHMYLRTYDKMFVLKLAIKLIGKDELYTWLNIPKHRYDTPICIAMDEHNLQYIVFRTVLNNIRSDDEAYDKIIQCCKALNLETDKIMGQTVYYLNV